MKKLEFFFWRFFWLVARRGTKAPRAPKVQTAQGRLEK